MSVIMGLRQVALRMQCLARRAMTGLAVVYSVAACTDAPAPASSDDALPPAAVTMPDAQTGSAACVDGICPPPPEGAAEAAPWDLCAALHQRAGVPYQPGSKVSWNRLT